MRAGCGDGGDGGLRGQRRRNARLFASKPIEERAFRAFAIACAWRGRRYARRVDDWRRRLFGRFFGAASVNVDDACAIVSLKIVLL